MASMDSRCGRLKGEQKERCEEREEAQAARTAEREHQLECRELSRDISGVKRDIKSLPECREYDRQLREIERACGRSNRRGAIDIGGALDCGILSQQEERGIPGLNDVLRGGSTPKERCEEAKAPLNERLKTLEDAAVNLDCNFGTRRR